MRGLHIEIDARSSVHCGILGPLGLARRDEAVNRTWFQSPPSLAALEIGWLHPADRIKSRRLADFSTVQDFGVSQDFLRFILLVL